MALTVSDKPVTPTVVNAPPNHTVGVEPMPDEMRRPGSAMLTHARSAVVERYNGALIRVLTTDNDDMRRRPLTDIVAAYAAEVHAVVVAPTWPACTYCGQPDDEAHWLLDHDRLGARRESRWRDELVPAAVTVVGFAR